MENIVLPTHGDAEDKSSVLFLLTLCSLNSGLTDAHGLEKKDLFKNSGGY